jgi:ribonuclease PH
VKRNDGRQADQLRPVAITRNFLKDPEGSVLMAMGNTKVICTASVENGVPSFLRGKGTGWLTAEYQMLPRSTTTRTPREALRGKVSGRTQEIMRLVGRSLRSVMDLSKLGERTIYIDCDVIQADGGTRTASITGGYVALADAVTRLEQAGAIPAGVLRGAVAAVSVGVVAGVALLDLNYPEDSQADVDMNIVMTGQGKFVELQSTAEKEAFDQALLKRMITLGSKGIRQLIAAQKKALIN